MIDYESGVIGSLLIDPNPVLPILRGCLTEDSFTLEANKSIYKAACKLADTFKPLDVVTIGQAAGTSQEYLLELMQTTPTAANVKAYVEGLITQNMKFAVRSLADDISERIALEPPQQLLAYIKDEADRIAEEQKSNDLISSEAVMQSLSNRIVAIQSKLIKPSVLSGFCDIDEILNGFAPEGLYILAARPGGGKTTLGLQIAERVAKRGEPTLFVSLEMSKEQIAAKRAAEETGISYGSIYNGDLDLEQSESVIEAVQMLGERPLYVNRRRTASVDDIAFMARQVKGIKFLVIDYLGLVQNKYGSKLYEKVTDTSNKLKRLAMQLGIPILCLAQLNREVESRSNKMPCLADLRDSGAIEQDADGVLLLGGLTEDEREAGIADLTCIVAKNRHGRTGKLGLRWYLANGRIRGRDK